MQKFVSGAWHARDKTHDIAPILYGGDRKSAQKRLLKIIDSLPRTRTVVDKGDTIHVEFTSRFLRFVDDVEFYFAKEAVCICKTGRHP